MVAPRFSFLGGPKVESAEIREKFIKFFEEKNHTRMPSWPLILKDDPSVLFTSAGMQPLVPYFLGKKQPPAKRIVAVQKVFRATDIDEVGRDGYHQTFFEMLGNFGIGDYWKKEAIEWGWELLTKVFGFDGNKLVATVHTSDDEALRNLDQDAGAAAAGEDLPPRRRGELLGARPDRSVRARQRGLHRQGSAAGRRRSTSAIPSENCGRYLEIWNYRVPAVRPQVRRDARPAREAEHRHRRGSRAPHAGACRACPATCTGPISSSRW